MAVVMPTIELPKYISRCWQGGYHSRGAGPCFETVERAVAFRDRETRKIAEWCDARADKVASWDFDTNRWVKWREHWNATGWPDGREPGSGPR